MLRWRRPPSHSHVHIGRGGRAAPATHLESSDTADGGRPSMPRGEGDMGRAAAVDGRRCCHARAEPCERGQHTRSARRPGGSEGRHAAKRLEDAPAATARRGLAANVLAAPSEARRPEWHRGRGSPGAAADRLRGTRAGDGALGGVRAPSPLGRWTMRGSAAGRELGVSPAERGLAFGVGD